MKLYCATTNPGKLREFQAAAQRFGIDVEPLAGLNRIPPCEETGASFEENAVQKALHYAAYAPGALFADDSGLEVDALGGAPGIYSARFAGPEATDEANNRLLLERLKGAERRTARFVCVVALAGAGGGVRTFRGAAEGVMLEDPHGSNGFGYDPLFYFPELKCTFADLTEEQKLDVSHRGKALAQMFQQLINKPRA